MNLKRVSILYSTSAFFALVFFTAFSALASVTQDYEKAVQAFIQNKYKDAFIHVKNALQEEPEYLPAQLLLAKIYQVNGMFRYADNEFQKVYDEGGDVNLIYEPWGEVLLRLKESDRILALSVSDKLTTETRIKWYVVRARACMQQDRVLCAKREYEQILSMAPQHPVGLNGLALLAINENNFVKAQEYLSLSFDQDKQRAQTWWLKGKLAKENKHFEQAQAYFNQAFLLAPENPIMARSLIDAYIASSDFDAALLITEDLLVKAEDDLYVLFVNSWLVSQLDSLNAIRPQLEQIATRLANVQEELLLAEPALFYLRGMVALMQKNFETARENFMSFSKHAESDVQTAILLASTNIALGDKKAAMTALQSHEQELIDDNVQQALLLGSLYIDNHRNFKAVDLLEKLEKRYPSDINVRLFAIRVALSRKKIDEGDVLLDELLQQYPSNRQVLLAYALHYLNKGKPEQAKHAIKTLLEKYPSDIAIQNMFAAQLIIEKKYTQAQQILKRVLAQSPNLFAAQYNQATLYIHQREFQQAKDILVKLVALRPDHLQVAFQLAKIDFQLGEIQSAISGFRRILITHGAQANVTFAAVAAYAKIADYSSAIDLLRKLLAREPGNETALVQLASFYIKAGDNAHALATLQKLEILPELLINTQIAQAELWMALDHKEKALDTMEKAHELAPKNKNVHLQWVKLMLASGATDDAERELAVLHQNYPKDPFVYFKLGELAQQQGQLDTAYAQFMKVLELDERFDLALAKLYSLSVYRGDFTQLVSYLEALVARSPERYFPRNLLAQYHFYYGSHEQAIKHYLILLEKVEESSRFALLDRLANLYFDIDSLVAQEYAEQAYALAPNDANVLHSYGWSLALNNKYQESLPLLRDASVRNSTDLTLQYHLAYTLSHLGNVTEATQILERIVNAQFDFPERHNAVALLNKIAAN